MPSRTQGPYTVWLVTPDDAIAIPARSPRFSRTWRGGFKEGSVRLYEPLKSTNPLLAPLTKLRIDDSRTGRVAFEGYLDLPGKQRGDEGDVWDLGAVGPKARLEDIQRAYVGIDTSFEGWKLRNRTKGAMTAGQSGDPGDEEVDALVITWPDGMAIGAGDPDTGPRTTMAYDLLQHTGQFVGGVSFTHREGRNDSNVKTELDVSAAGVGGSFEVARSRVWNQALDTIAASAGAEFDVGEEGRNLAFLRVIRVSGIATNVAADTWWSATRNIRVSSLRRGQDAGWIYGDTLYDDDFLLAHDVIVDGLLWFCAQFTGVADQYTSPIDIEHAFIDDSFTHQIDQLIYTTPTSMGQMLEDLALFEPDMAWEVLESGQDGHRFALRRVLTGETLEGSNESGPRYHATSDDGWDEPGGEDELRNAVTVAWTGRDGKKESKTYSASDDFGIEVPELDQWGIVREGETIELGDDLGSEANADRIAEKYLEQASRPIASGTLTISRQKVHDAWNGRDVEVSEIEPGYPLLVTDLDITLPITDVDVDDNTAELTLAEPVLTDEQLVNAYARRRRRRR